MGSKYMLPGTEILSTQPVMKNAACRDQPHLPWVPDAHTGPGVQRIFQQDLVKMKSICQSCVHLIECREYALSDASIYGIWGGLTSIDRKEIRAGRRPHPVR